MSILPISNIINVSITDVPSGLTTPNVNSLALFTTDTPSNVEAYGDYISTSEVEANYGTNSVTTQMANAIFAQVPNILTGKGHLVIIPYQAAVAATNGNIHTADISANLTGLKAVTNGDLKVTVNGVAQNLINLNFSNTTTLADIAAILDAALIDCVVTASSTAITFTSNKVGTASTVALATYAGGGTDLAGTNYLHSATATATAGANASGETLLAAIARTKGSVFYAGVITNLLMEDAVIVTTAAGIQADDLMFVHHVASTTDIAGVGTTIQQAADTKTRIVLYSTSQATANLFKAAYAGRAFSVDFTGSNTSSTMNLKQLATIVPDPNITQTLYDAADTAGVDLYVSYAGVPSVFSTGGNDFFDNPYSDLALKFALETAGFNYLRQTNTKVPQTEPGMNGLKAAYAGICTQFVRAGAMAPGSWTSSETFGDPQIFTNNIMAQGYYIYSQPVAQQNASDRDDRIAPLVQIAIKRAGAIHKGDVIVLVNN